MAFSPRLILIALICLCLAGAGGYVWYLRAANYNLTEQVKVEQAKFEQVRQDLLRVTEERSVLDSQLKEAEVLRGTLVKSYDARLKALRGQKPPVECKAVIDWAIENRSDLAW